jgi:hypothetical protein
MTASTWGRNDDGGCPPAIHLKAGGPEGTVEAPWLQPEDDGRLRHRLPTADLRQKLTSPGPHRRQLGGGRGGAPMPHPAAPGYLPRLATGGGEAYLTRFLRHCCSQHIGVNLDLTSKAMPAQYLPVRDMGRTSKSAFVESHDKAARRVTGDFLRLAAALLYRMNTDLKKVKQTRRSER